MRYLIPIAGDDDLFPRAEYHFPKPLIEIAGKPMIVHAIDSLRASDPKAEFIFIVKSEQCHSHGIDLVLTAATGGECSIIKVNGNTAGAACSALMAVDHIDDDKPLVICNGDQVISGGVDLALQKFAHLGSDAGVITFDSVHPRWSYARLDSQGIVIETAEKRVISRSAIAGFYFFQKGREFVRAAKSSILNGAYNSSHFISPTINELILQGGTCHAFTIAPDKYQSFYSPQRLSAFEKAIGKQSIEQTAPQINVVIPMAGLGSRFSSAGYEKPKPFIDVAGVPMIQRVMQNLAVDNASYILIARDEHLSLERDLVDQLEADGNVNIVPINFVTEGAACTVMLASKRWSNSAPLLIANCDQIIDFDVSDFVKDANARNLDGSILVFRDTERDPKWSFAKLSDEGLVSEVREKQAISDLATVGIYYFSKAELFQECAIEMISRGDRVNNEFYVCPVYNYAIERGAKIGVYEISRKQMHGIGTPEDLSAFLELRYQK